MSINPADPRLTAYALGELDDVDRAKLEAALKDSAPARRMVDQIRETADSITRELQSDPVMALGPDQRIDIERRINTLARRHEGWTYVLRRWRPAAIAASLLVIAGASALLPALLRPGADPVAGPMVMSDKLNQPGRNPEASAPRFSPADVSKLNGIGHTSPGAPAPVSADSPELLFAQPFVDGVRAHHDADPDDIIVAVGSMANLESTSETYTGPELVFKLGIDQFKLGIDEPYNQAVLVPPESQSQLASLGYVSSPQVDGYFDSFKYYSDPGSRTLADTGMRWMADRSTIQAEAYDSVYDSPFLAVTQQPLSTFSIDVDTASYSNVRRFLNEGHRPPAGAVRIEEMINYFSYDYAPPGDEDAPFAAHVEVAECPWAPDHRLMRIGLKGYDIHPDERPASNLVFLIDVSGSMESANKLPLLKQAMQMLVRQLGRTDRVAIVTYAGESGLALRSTPCSNQRAILAAIDTLSAGGSTNGASGIQLAYDTAWSGFIEGGVNRVILATDGDFNVGVTDNNELVRLIEEKAAGGIFLSVLGFGMGNLQDNRLETLADKGNGNYAYIDDVYEAQKVLVEELAGTLVTIAKDVKIQIEFNPAQVQAYRLIGYENRIMAAEHFNDDTKDAGEIGAGHTVTALYELVPVQAMQRDIAERGRQGERERGSDVEGEVDPLKYQIPADSELTDAAASSELLTIKLRYKEPDGEASELLEFPVIDADADWAQVSPDFKFAAAVAAFGMILRDSPHVGDWTMNEVLELAQEGLGRDDSGYRAEFLSLIERARSLPTR